MWEYDVKLLHPWNKNGLWRILRWRSDRTGIANDMGRFRSKADAWTYVDKVLENERDDNCEEAVVDSSPTP
jgi:hypothetical protein